MSDQNTARTLSNGEPCSYADFEGTESWHEHDHVACQDAVDAEPAVPVEHKFAGGMVGGPGECVAWCTCGVEFAGFDSPAEASECLDRHIADEGPAVSLEEALRPAEEKRAARKLAMGYAAGLRALAGMLETHPELAKFASLDHLYAFHVRTAEDQAAFARAALRTGGKVDKDVWDKQHNIILRWGPVGAMVLANREDVCRRVLVGTETVTETVPDPEAMAGVPMVEVSKEVERYEWVCTPLLAATGEAGAS